MYQLRPYQQTFIDNIRTSLAKKNKKILGILANNKEKLAKIITISL